MQCGLRHRLIRQSLHLQNLAEDAYHELRLRPANGTVLDLFCTPLAQGAMATWDNSKLRFLFEANDTGKSGCDGRGAIVAAALGRLEFELREEQGGCFGRGGNGGCAIFAIFLSERWQ
jgi:hypothetical protein